MITARQTRGLLAAAGLGLSTASLGSLSAQDIAPVAGESDSRDHASIGDFRGIWFLEGSQAGLAGVDIEAIRSGRGLPFLNPRAPWNEDGRARLAEVWTNAATRKSLGWGYPAMMGSLTPIQIVVTPDETLILNTYRDVRHISTDGRSLTSPEDRWHTTWGESVGRWEDGALLIETVAVREPNQYFLLAPPLSDEARYSERLRKTGPDRLELEITIEDPATLSAPWSLNIAYVRAELLDRIEFDDFVNDRNVVEGDAFAIVPPAEAMKE